LPWLRDEVKEKYCIVNEDNSSETKYPSFMHVFLVLFWCSLSGPQLILRDLALQHVLRSSARKLAGAVSATLDALAILWIVLYFWMYWLIQYMFSRQNVVLYVYLFWIKGLDDHLYNHWFLFLLGWLGHSLLIYYDYL